MPGSSMTGGYVSDKSRAAGGPGAPAAGTTDPTIPLPCTSV